MDRKDIANRMKETIQRHHPDKKLTFTEDTNLSDVTNLDSIDVVEIILALQEEFEISMTDKEVQNVTTIGKFIDLLSDKLR
ncbi:phosphopantetheine-binding protein [Pseudomonas viridiflava]|uniref:phosphopantetheine-binding protein n=1 Tax=Pseudomonas viridiflava TaxID=33069 RepID=UPI002EB0CF8A|nr:phosphopantetheine-binding protein [Pseudomonas viridiflava]